MGSCNKYKGRICAKEREGVFIFEREEERDIKVHFWTTEERIYQTLEITSNGTNVFCRKEEWKEEDGTELLLFK